MLQYNFEYGQVNEFSFLKNKLEKIRGKQLPSFVRHKCDVNAVVKLAKKYNKYSNIIIMGNGGSITSFQATLSALYPNKNVYIVDTPEPNYLNDIKQECPKKDTLVIVISKSGNTVAVMQSYFMFFDYKTVIVTENNDGVLNKVAKTLKLDHYTHPPVGGRFTGNTVVNYLPSALCGFDVKKMDKAFTDANTMLQELDVTKNPALEAAAICYLLEQEGYEQIFMPLYSHYLEGFSTLIMQLVHESSGKNGKGQTVITAVAPESQHHTNQRFFGGKQNMIGFFITVEDDSNTQTIHVPKQLEKLYMKGHKLTKLEGISYEEALHNEFIGVFQHTIDGKIPALHINLKGISEETIAQLIAFFNWFAVYSAYLRDQDPFDQPEVEGSKNISFNRLFE